MAGQGERVQGGRGRAGRGRVKGQTLCPSRTSASQSSASQHSPPMCTSKLCAPGKILGIAASIWCGFWPIPGAHSFSAIAGEGINMRRKGPDGEPIDVDGSRRVCVCHGGLQKWNHHCTPYRKLCRQSRRPVSPAPAQRLSRSSHHAQGAHSFEVHIGGAMWIST
jgi:hypothetical protein